MTYNTILTILILINTAFILHLFNIKRKNKQNFKNLNLNLNSQISDLKGKNNFRDKHFLQFFAKQHLGYKTVLISALSLKSKAIISIESYYGFLHGISKAYDSKVQFIILGRQETISRCQIASLPLNTELILEETQFENFEEYVNYMNFFKPYLVINLACEIIPRIFKFANILNDGSPFQENLSLTSSHVFLLDAISCNYKKIIELKITESENNTVERIKEILRLKISTPMNEYDEILELSNKQFKNFYSSFQSVILFSYSCFMYDVADGKEEIKRILSSIPKNILIIMTIHPALKEKNWFELFKTAAKTTDVDCKISAELTGESLENAPLAELKKEFPNLMIENELELYALNGKPNLRPFTELLIPFVDGIIAHSSKVCFNAMYFEKPIFSYNAEENNANVYNFSLTLSGFSVSDVANFNFQDTQWIKLKTMEWNKIFHFMFTRLFQKKDFYSGNDVNAILDFVKYQQHVRNLNFSEIDFEFYEKEWQTIEEVLNVFENV